MCVALSLFDEPHAARDPGRMSKRSFEVKPRFQRKLQDRPRTGGGCFRRNLLF
jgi:hypothetical protein